MSVTLGWLDRAMEPERRRAFEATALPLLDTLFGVALRMTRDSASAEDLVQDTMVRAYRFWDGFQPGTSAKAWMLTILRNTYINGYHKNRRLRVAQDEVVRHVQSFGEGAATMHLGGPATSPEQALIASRERDQIYAALESLPEDYKTAVILADLEGLAYKEIAEVMGCPIGTVMSRIHRGRKLLHKMLFASDDASAHSPLAAALGHDGGDRAAEMDGAVSLTDWRNKKVQA